MITELRRIPAPSKLGLVLMVAAAGLDIAVHVVSGGHAGHHAPSLAHVAHLLGIAGMVLVLAGVVVHGARRQLRQRAASHGGLDAHAHR